MYKKIIEHKENIINTHIEKMNEYKYEQNKTEEKRQNAYKDLKELNYTNEVSLFEVKSKMLYLRDLIEALNKEFSFYENYIQHETNHILFLNLELEKYKTIQFELETKILEEKNREEEEMMMELLNLSDLSYRRKK